MEKEKELEINNLITLRNNYFLIIIGLTGGCVGLLLADISIIKIIFFILGLILDFIFVLNAQKCSDRINNIIKRGK